MTFLLSMLFGFKQLLSGFLSWVTANPQRIAIVALIALCGYLALSNVSLRGDVRQKTKIIALRDATIKQMIAQNDAATQKAKVNVKRIRKLYAEISNEAEKDYATRLADSRNALERWKLQHRGSSASQDNSATIPKMPSDPLQDTPQTEFLVRGEDLDIAAENYSQLVALIDWAKAIGNVETVPAS